MTESKTLAAMSEEYLDAIAKTEDIIKETRLKLHAAEKSFKNDEAAKCRVKLSVLYEEVRDMKHIASYIRNYYDDRAEAERIGA